MTVCTLARIPVRVVRRPQPKARAYERWNTDVFLDPKQGEKAMAKYEKALLELWDDTTWQSAGRSAKHGP